MVFKLGEEKERGWRFPICCLRATPSFFCNARKEVLEYLSWILMWFEAMSDLKINLEKSKLIPIGEVSNLEDLVEALGCKEGSLPSTYLKLPLGAPFKSSRVWDGVEKRFRIRLVLWRREYLSKGGRLTLLKSTLSSLLMYFVSLCHSKESSC